MVVVVVVVVVVVNVTVINVNFTCLRVNETLVCDHSNESYSAVLQGSKINLKSSLPFCQVARKFYFPGKVLTTF